MSDTVLLYFPADTALAESLARHSGLRLAPLALHGFPDGETRVTLPTDLAGSNVVLLCSLNQPDSKTVALLFAADTARELGARRVGLLAPYLAYMRQDCRFAPGQAVASRCYAGLLSTHFDFLLTVDPHLHRHASLDEIYTMPALAISAAPAIADWISAKLGQPLLVGPDSESAQWLQAVARRIGAPFLVLDKTRHGDREVSVSLPDAAAWQGHQPVLIDDILSSARTMAAAVVQLRAAGLAAPVCIGVHPILAGDALAVLQASGPAAVVSCNSIAHPSNRIDLAPLLAEALLPLCRTGG